MSFQENTYFIEIINFMKCDTNMHDFEKYKTTDD